MGVFLGALLLNFTLAQYQWGTDKFNYINVATFDRGQVVEFTNLEEFCHSSILFIAFAQYDYRVLGAIYILLLCYCFLGIAIISDIFMEGIEEITAQKTLVIVKDSMGYEVPK